MIMMKMKTLPPPPSPFHPPPGSYHQIITTPQGSLQCGLPTTKRHTEYQLKVAVHCNNFRQQVDAVSRHLQEFNWECYVCNVTFQRLRIKAFFSAILLATHLYNLSKWSSNSGTSCSDDLNHNKHLVITTPVMGNYKSNHSPKS